MHTETIRTRQQKAKEQLAAAKEQHWFFNLAQATKNWPVQASI